MKKILLTLALIICSFSNSYTSQDRYYLALSSYDGQSVNGQDRSSFATRITGMQNYIAEKQDLLAQAIVLSVYCIPRTAARIVDFTMPLQKKSVYFLCGDKILQFDQSKMQKNRKQHYE
ncbi:MAG: hypothetical protein Q8Q60_01760 [Candidatus Chromulinivorax sp.]|nr:hypothetical protein [Candidatus Chromulinivorax sp.]